MLGNFNEDEREPSINYSNCPLQCFSFDFLSEDLLPEVFTPILTEPQTNTYCRAKF